MHMLRIHLEMQCESHEPPFRTYTRWVQFYRNGSRRLSALAGAALALYKGGMSPDDVRETVDVCTMDR